MEVKQLAEPSELKSTDIKSAKNSILKAWYYPENGSARVLCYCKWF